jgi:hypothetical protein
MTRLAIFALVTGFLAIALCSIPILGYLFGLAAAGTGAFVSIRASRRDVRIAAATGLLFGVLGIYGVVNWSMESLAAYQSRQGVVIEADEIKK